MNIFGTKKNKALSEARKLLKAAELSELKAQQEKDWAESMEIYHKLRAESLREYIVRLELIETPTTSTPPMPAAVVNETKPVVVKAASAVRKSISTIGRRLPTGGLVEA